MTRRILNPTAEDKRKEMALTMLKAIKKRTRLEIFDGFCMECGSHTDDPACDCLTGAAEQEMS